MKHLCVSDVEGAWVDANWESSLISRCKECWDTPITELPDVMIATYLRQGIAVQLLVEEARRRIESGSRDDSELFEGQLAEALERSQLD